jgi:hypothetical protein
VHQNQVAMRKLYYAPGIITLVGLLFLLPWCFKKIVPKKQTLLKFYVPKKQGGPDQFSETYTSEYISPKKKLKVILDGDKLTNLKKLDLIRYEARKLKYSCDTSSIILLNFTDEFSYGDFIKLLDQCKQDSIRRYSILGNGFVIFGEAPPKKAEIKYAHPDFISDVIIIPPPKKPFEKRFLIAMTRYSNFQTLSLSIGWIILVITHLYFQQKKKKVSDSSSTP